LLLLDELFTDAAALTALALLEPDVDGLSVPDDVPFAKLEFDVVVVVLVVVEVVAGATLALAACTWLPTLVL